MFFVKSARRILLSTLLVACAARAEICAIATVGGLIAEADAIVAGSVASAGNATEGKFLNVVIVAREVIDGSLPPGPLVFRIPIRYDWQMAQDFAGRRVLAFLRIMPDGRPMEAIPWARCSSGPSLPKDSVLVYPETADPILETETSDSPMQKLIKELAVLADTDPWPRAANSLVELARGHVEVPTLHEVFRVLMADRDPTLFRLGLLGSANAGDVVGLRSIDEVIRSGQDFNREEVFEAIERSFVDKDAEAISLLRRWLGPQQPTDQRVAAAGALLRLQTAASTIVLGEALADADQKVRWRAVQGLIPFANFGPGGPNNPRKDWPLRSRQTHLNSISTASMYAANEQPWLDFWRSWWRENQAAVRALAGQAGGR